MIAKVNLIVGGDRRGDMAMSGEGRRHHNLVPLAALISRELRNEKMETPSVRYGCAAQSRKGEDYFLMKTDCQRVPGNASSTFSVFAVCFYAFLLSLYVILYNLNGKWKDQGR